MSPDRETLERSEVGDAPQRGGSAPAPGLLLVFADGRPATVCIPLVDGRIALGRDHAAFAAHPDPRVSRRHVEVRRTGARWTVTDVGSRNGAVVDGEPLTSGSTAPLAHVLHIGDSLLVPLPDLGPLQRMGVRFVDGRVEGPGTQAAVQSAARIARSGTTLHITGETGAGKEGLARAFHVGGPAAHGPFQAVNCAAVPEGVAERLLFGTRRGAYSGADADADGYIQAASGGTLFLDEVAELPLAVQAKLLRTLETGEVLALGASRPRRVELRFCSATHLDLRALAAAGKFREDLYYRIATPSVAAPPLRDRPEEVAWLLQRVVEQTAPGRALHVSLVEACLLRPWPGNVRELLGEARSAAQQAISADAPRVEAAHLGAGAGLAMTAPTVAARGRTMDAATTTTTPPTRARLIGVLRRVDGNISAAARELGVHRTQLKRWLDRLGIAASQPTRDEPGE